METDLLKDLTRTELPNKLQIWCRGLPNTDFISLRLIIMVGSAHQNLKNLGLAHFVEHLVFNFGNENNSVKQLFDEIEQSGGYLNATTGLSSTLFTADISCNKLEKCLELIENCFLCPDFSDKTINNERSVILNELQNEPNEFWYRIYRKVLGNHALAYSGIGTVYIFRPYWTLLPVASLQLSASLGHRFG
jgi:predicted Zn-dependent peptidase